MPLLSPNNFNVGNTTAREIVLNSDGNVADWGTVTESWIGVRAELPTVISYSVLAVLFFYYQGII